MFGLLAPFAFILLKELLHKKAPNHAPKMQVQKKLDDLALRVMNVEERKREEVRIKRELEDYPEPSFLKEKGDGKINVALAGKSGKGKSTLINTIRGLKPNDPNAAKVGAVETTTDPAPYSFPGSEDILLWDLPGSETPNYPLDTYVSRLGLRYFDAVIIVSAGPLHEGDLRLMNEVKKHGVPFYFVRNQVNLDVRYQEEDYDIPAEETLQKIASGMKKNGVMAPYLVNAKNLKQFDGPKLVRDIGNTIAKDRTTDTSAEGQLSNKPVSSEKKTFWIF